MTALLNTIVPFFARRSMAACGHGSNLYFFGGVGAAGTESILDVSADLWCFDTGASSWRPIARSDPWPSARRCAGWAARHEHLLLWGGSGVLVEGEGTRRHTFLNDLWRFDTTAETWSLLRPTDDHRCTPVDGDAFPFPRYTPVFQLVDDELFLFGGYTEDRLGKRKLNDAWICSDSQWQQIPIGARPGHTAGSDWPGPRYGSMAVADANNVYVCGGFSDDGDHIDLWGFDMTSRQWRLLSPDQDSGETPTARYCAAFALYGRRLFLFGGRSRRFPKLNFNDLWAFDLDAGKWSMLTGHRLPHRYDSAAQYPGYHAKASSVVVGHHWYLWGGEGLHGHVSDFWRYDFESLGWQLIQGARGDDPVFW